MLCFQLVFLCSESTSLRKNESFAYMTPSLDYHVVLMTICQPFTYEHWEDGIEPRDIVLRFRSGPLHRISDLHPAYAPLQYPLLFPYGENGWYPEMKLRESEEQQGHRLQQRNQRHQERQESGLDMDVEDRNLASSGSRRLTLVM